MYDASVRPFMEPQWFFPLFIAMWFGITGLLAHLGGWASLARRYRATRDGLTEVGGAGDPETGRVGLEQTDCGFIQTAFHELLVWGCR